ncbi:hypothetical protein Spiro2_001879 [Spirobacillus cienkowskii]|jgi:hypothetical protein
MQKFFVNLDKSLIYWSISWFMIGHLISETYKHFFNIHPLTDLFIGVYNLFLHIFN